MERRYEARLEEMLEDAEVSPEMLEGMLNRLETFIEPFAEALDEPAQRRHALEYTTGLLSDLKHKTGEAIAYLHDQKRQGIQKFIGHVPWDHQPLFATLADQVGEQLGEPDAVLVFDPSGFAKKGVKFTHLVFCFAPTTSAGRLPQPIRLPIARSRGFHLASGTIRPSDDSPGVASHFALRLILVFDSCAGF